MTTLHRAAALLPTLGRLHHHGSRSKYHGLFTGPSMNIPSAHSILQPRKLCGRSAASQNVAGKEDVKDFGITDKPFSFHKVAEHEAILYTDYLESQVEGVEQHPDMMTIMQSRIPKRKELTDYPMYLMRIAGVSFDGRQEVLKNTVQGSPIIFEAEPGNPYDPNAVRILSFHDEVIGYVPREATHLFHEKTTTFGRVASVAVAESGLLGALVLVQPQLPYMVMDYFPESLLPCKDLVNHLSVRKRKEFLSGINATTECSITKLEAEVEIRLMEDWIQTVNPLGIKLQGMKRCCGALADLERKPLEMLLPKDVAMLSWVNRWHPYEASAYLKLCSNRRGRNVIQDDGNPVVWNIDISFLSCVHRVLPKGYVDHLYSSHTPLGKAGRKSIRFEHFFVSINSLSDSSQDQ